MHSGPRWFASGRWASQQSGEQKWSGNRFLLQVDTEHLYQRPPQEMGFLQMLQRDQDEASIIEGLRGGMRRTRECRPARARNTRPAAAPNPELTPAGKLAHLCLSAHVAVNRGSRPCPTP